jgi:hypothetical protein
MKKNMFLTFVAGVTMVFMASCSKEAVIDTTVPGNSPRVRVSLVGFGEPNEKASLDFERVSNVMWADNDTVAVFDGAQKNKFGIEGGTNTGTSATFTGYAAENATLYAVYPYSAGNSLNGSQLSVTVPSHQVIGSHACIDTSAMVSVGKAVSNEIVFKQVCGLIKIIVSGNNVRRLILTGNSLTGTALVSADGTVSSVTDGSDTVELTYEGGGNFPTGTYYAAVLPGTTAAGSFSVQLVSGGGLTWQKSASSAVTVVRKTVISAGDVDSEATFVRHITNKDELYAWGAVMGEEHNVTVWLDADIDCASDPWVGTGATFDGTFEGQDHKIYNLVVTYDGDNTGFISRLTGSLNNVIIGSSNGTSWDNVSCITHNGTSDIDADTHYLGLVGRLAGNGNMEGVTNFASIVVAAKNTRAYVGGLVGLIPGGEIVTMTNCTNYGSVTNNSTWTGGQTRMGGILGQGSGTLAATGIENYGALTINNGVTNFVGGLCGDIGSDSSITSASNYGTITFTDEGTQKTYIGGCFGSIRGSSLYDCHNYAPITVTRSAEHWFGGIAGYMEAGESALTECINHTGADLTVSSTVVSKRVIMGGITGGCQYNGSGPFAVTIDDCRNEASIINQGSASDFGGIAGLFDNYLSSATISITNCENTGAISSTVMDDGTSLSRELRVGGIIGGTDPESTGCEQVYRSCINRGNVTINGAIKKGASVRVGGIVGNSYYCTTIDQCKNFGNVGCEVAGSDAGSAVFVFGGILGYIQDRSESRYEQVTNCINTGTVSTVRAYNNQYLGGIVGGGNTQSNVYPQVTGCKNFGNVFATKTTNTLVGGLCGYIKFTLANSSNFGDVTGGAWNGAIVGDGNASAVLSDGIKVGDGVEVTGAANAGAKYSQGKKTYSFTTAASIEKYWFSGWSDAAITVTVVDQETYSE